MIISTFIDASPRLLLHKHALPPAGEEIPHRGSRARQVLPDDVHGRAREDEVDLLEPLVLGLGHEEDLVEVVVMAS
jgi:hypothetical protein